MSGSQTTELETQLGSLLLTNSPRGVQQRLENAFVVRRFIISLPCVSLSCCHRLLNNRSIFASLTELPIRHTEGCSSKTTMSLVFALRFDGDLMSLIASDFYKIILPKDFFLLACRVL